MASNWLYIDTNFPTFTGEESTKEQVTTIQNYLYMLVEQLRYTLRNLDLANMNQSAVTDFTNTITEPIYIQLKAENGQITALSATAEGLSSRMLDAEGQISQLSQTVEGFAISVSNGSTSSILSLKSGDVTISSATIRFTGMVTFSALSTQGATTINGSNITTGTITAITMQGNEIIGGTITGATLRSVSGSDNGLEIYYGAVSNDLLVGGVKFDANGAGTAEEARYRMYIYTNTTAGVAWAMKLISAGGMSLESGAGIYIEAGTTLAMRATGQLSIHKAILYDEEENSWQFQADGLYKNGTRVLEA